MLLKDNEMEEIDNSLPKNYAKLKLFQDEMNANGDDVEYEIIKLVRDIRFKNNSCIVAEIVHKPCGSHFHLSKSDFYPKNAKNAPNRCPLCSGNRPYSRETLENLCNFKGFDLISVTQEDPDVIKSKTDSATIRCRTCNSEFTHKVRYITSGNKVCTKCASEDKKSVGEIVNPGGYDVFKETNGKYTQLTSFTNHNSPITFLCNECGNQFKRCMYEFKRGDRCTSFICKYKKRLQEELNNEYHVSESNVILPLNGKEPIILTHHCSDGKERDILYNRCNTVFNNKKYCPYCYGLPGSKMKPMKTVIEEIEARYPDNEYEFIDFVGGDDAYLKTGSKTFANIKHNVESCGQVFQAQVGSFLSTKGQKCPCLKNSFYITDEYIQERLDERFGKGECTYLRRYVEKQVNSETFTRTLIDVQHNCDKCGNHVSTYRLDSINDRKYCCQMCMSFEQESFISRTFRELLDENNVKYIREHTYSDCKYERELPFDYFLTELGLLIELDGSQHFKDTGSWNSDGGLEMRHLRDSIKTKYCIENQLTLIRIPYMKEKELGEIMKSILDGSYDTLTDIMVVKEGDVICMSECYDFLFEGNDKNT